MANKIPVVTKTYKVPGESFLAEDLERISAELPNGASIYGLTVTETRRDDNGDPYVEVKITYRAMLIGNSTRPNVPIPDGTFTEPICINTSVTN